MGWGGCPPALFYLLACSAAISLAIAFEAKACRGPSPEAGEGVRSGPSVPRSLNDQHIAEGKGGLAFGSNGALPLNWVIRKPAVKVTHLEREHLLCLSSEEVALLVDLCHAATFSDMLPTEKETQRRLKRFMGEVQTSLHDTAQLLWKEKQRRSKLRQA